MELGIIILVLFLIKNYLSTRDPKKKEICKYHKWVEVEVGVDNLRYMKCEVCKRLPGDEDFYEVSKE